MTRPLRPILAGALCAMCFGLGSCGDIEQDPLLTNIQSLASLARLGREAEAAPGTGAPLTVTRDLVAQFDIPLLLVEYPASGGGAFMTVLGRNGPIRTWQGAEGLSFNLTDRGLLRSTRGLGFDLMASDVRETEAAVRHRQPRDTDRVLVHLDGDVQEVRSTHRCHFRVVGPETLTIVERPVRLTHAVETCRHSGGTYDNEYWIDSHGRAVRSLQWVSEEVGHYRFTRLNF